MRRLAAISVALILMACNMASADIYAITNELGYQGTIWNITDSTGPWATTTSPRAGYLYYSDAADPAEDYNILMSNWSGHSPSNTNNSFFQLYDIGNATVTSATGGWDPSLTTFTLTVKGENAPYPWSRFWQPDNGVAWGVTFTGYTYSVVATFSTAATPDGNGGYINSVAPDTITGSFAGKFIVTMDVNKNPITNGDLYGFDISLDKSLFPGLTSGEVANVFDGSIVPVPGAVLLGMLGLGAAGLRLRRRG